MTKPLPQAVINYLAAIGRKGGRASVSKGVGCLTKEQRSAHMRMMANARWHRGEAATASKPEAQQETDVENK
jgi:hypothetical protein